MTRRLRHGNRSTTTTGRAQASWITTANGIAGPQQPVVSVRACCGGAGRGDRARLFSAGRSAVVPDHGGTGGLVSCACGPSIPERLLRRTRARPEGGRAGHRESEGGWLGCCLDRQRANRPVQVDRDQSRQRHRRELETSAADLAKPVQTRASPGVRLTRSAWPRPRRFATFPRTLRDQLQGVLLAKPGGSATPGPIGTRTSGCSKIGSIRIRLAPRGSTR